MSFFFFFFNDTATTEIYTLSLHDALPIYTFASAYAMSMSGTNLYIPDAAGQRVLTVDVSHPISPAIAHVMNVPGDRKSTRLNSSHQIISYAVFCLKKKKKIRKCKTVRYIS